MTYSLEKATRQRAMLTMGTPIHGCTWVV